MQTLTLHSHFALSPDIHYQRESQFQKETSQPNAVNKKVSALREMNVKGLEIKKTRSDSTSEKKDWNKENKSINLSNFAPVSYVESLTDPHTPEREYFMRCVVIGTENTGKHTLINANLQQNTHPQQKREADLIIKDKVHFKTTKRYHFWIRTLNQTSEAKEIIWRTYYKWATAFVFVYDITNGESFEALEKAAESVLRVVPREKFFGILLGNKNDLDGQREIDHNMAMEFKEKYNFSHFIETNASMEKIAPELLPKIDTKLKLTFESI